MLFNKPISEDFCILFVRNKNTDRLIRRIELILKHKFDSIDFVESTYNAGKLVKILYNKYLLMYMAESMYNKLSTNKYLKSILNDTKVQGEYLDNIDDMIDLDSPLYNGHSNEDNRQYTNTNCEDDMKKQQIQSVRKITIL